MTTPYDPDAINKQMNSGGAVTPGPTAVTGVSKEAAPLDQSDAVILANTKTEYDNTPVPGGRYAAMIDKADFGFTKKGKPKINVTWRITGPAQIGRLVWLTLSPRSGEGGAIFLHKFLIRTQKADAKGEYQPLIDSVDKNAPFDEKKFCDLGIAIGAEATISCVLGAAYTNKAGEKVVPTNIKDVMPPNTGQKFM